MVQITHVRLSTGGTGHEHITLVKWYNPGKDSGKVGETNVAGMVTFLKEGNRAYVCDGQEIVDVAVVDAKTPYIRTKKDGKLRDNLLSLPRF